MERPLKNTSARSSIPPSTVKLIFSSFHASGTVQTAEYSNVPVSRNEYAQFTFREEEDSFSGRNDHSARESFGL